MNKCFRAITLLLMLNLSAFAIAQINPSSENELISYFERNKEHLDPIEGIYNLNMEFYGENAFVKFPPLTTNETAYIYKNLSGEFKIWGDNQITIKRIGNTSIYNFSIFWKGSNITDTKRFTLKGGVMFDIQHEVPDLQLRYDLKRNYHPGDRTYFIRSYIKEYPN